MKEEGLILICMVIWYIGKYDTTISMHSETANKNITTYQKDHCVSEAERRVLLWRPGVQAEQHNNLSSWSE